MNKESNSMFPFKYRLRKTDEQVEIVAWETIEKGARNENDWVSYIDAQGNEHFKEHLTLEWDFVVDSPFEKIISGGFGSGLDKYDPWESRRFELVKELVVENGDDPDTAIEWANEIISKLKKSQEAVEEDPKKGL